MLSRVELDAVARVAIEHDLLVVTDEVYEHLAFDEPHIPIAKLPGMAQRTVSISSAGKTFSFTGWKIGWVTGPAELVAAVRTTKQFLTFVSGGPFQFAVAHALDNEMPWVEGLRESMADRRDLLSRWPRTARADDLPSPRHLLRHHRHPLPGLGRRARLLPCAAGARRRGGGAMLSLLRGPRSGRTRPGPVDVQQAGEGPRDALGRARDRRT